MKDLTTPKGRIKAYLKEIKKTQREFTELTGIPAITLNKKTELSSTTLRKLGTAFPDLNILWIVGLDDQMLKNNDNRKELQQLKQENETLNRKVIKQEGQIEILNAIIDRFRTHDNENNKEKP